MFLCNPWPFRTPVYSTRSFYTFRQYVSSFITRNANIFLCYWCCWWCCWYCVRLGRHQHARFFKQLFEFILDLRLAGSLHCVPRAKNNPRRFQPRQKPPVTFAKQSARTISSHRFFTIAAGYDKRITAPARRRLDYLYRAMTTGKVFPLSPN